MSAPKLSIVVGGRNDNHNGDFDLRAEYAIRHNVALLHRHKVDFEFLWVEWNPIPDRPLLAQSVRQWVNPFHAYIVPHAIHADLCDNPSIGVMQFHAKNVGIRRASGDWVLSMNADTYLTEAVIKFIAANQLAPNTMYLATRIDFDSSFLQTPPSAYPVPGLEQRRVTLVSTINIPNSYGSAGDFTLLPRIAFQEMGAHFEGIRFSNHHMDTLLCNQWKARGGTFQELGNIYHADHKDSWNNFAASDDRKHHGGCNYNCRDVKIPYTNSVFWGLGSFREAQIDADITELKPPPNLILRKTMPASVQIPAEYSGLVEFATRFQKAVATLRDTKQRIIFYGLGEQVRRSITRGELQGLHILGYLDDNMTSYPEIPYPLLTWQQALDLAPDAVLIGSFYWAKDLSQKALAHIPREKIFPKICPIV